MPDVKIPAYDSGEHFSAYVAYPQNQSAPAVLVIQEIFGVNGEMRAKCDALAVQGYMAVCPDLFWRIEPGIRLSDAVPEELQRAFALFGQFDIEKGLEDLKATLDFIREHGRFGGRAGCVGYCLGGKLAYMMACRSDIDASVSYYGVGIENMLDEAKNIKQPLLMHIAEEDKFVSKEAQEQIKAGLSRNQRVQIHTYPGADHAFARTGGAHYNEEAARLANNRTAAYLENELKKKQPRSF